MTDIDHGVAFFAAGVSAFAGVPAVVRPFVFQVCARQTVLSATIAAETLQAAPHLAAVLPNTDALQAIYQVAAAIARRSAKHSADFLRATPHVLASFGSTKLPKLPSIAHSRTRQNDEQLNAAIELVQAFAEHAGGIAADAWASLPQVISGLNPQQSLLLMKRAAGFLERGGAAALHVLLAGGEVLRALPECFDEWLDLLWTIAPHGNAGLVAFIRASPSFFLAIAATPDREGAATLAHRVISLAGDVGKIDF